MGIEHLVTKAIAIQFDLGPRPDSVTQGDVMEKAFKEEIAYACKGIDGIIMSIKMPDALEHSFGTLTGWMTIEYCPSERIEDVFDLLDRKIDEYSESDD